MMAKEYTSAFWDPSLGGLLLRRISGAVHSLPEEEVVGLNYLLEKKQGWKCE